MKSKDVKVGEEYVVKATRYGVNRAMVVGEPAQHRSGYSAYAKVSLMIPIMRLVAETGLAEGAVRWVRPANVIRTWAEHQVLAEAANRYNAREKRYQAMIELVRDNVWVSPAQPALGLPGWITVFVVVADRDAGRIVAALDVPEGVNLETRWGMGGAIEEIVKAHQQILANKHRADVERLVGPAPKRDNWEND